MKKAVPFLMLLFVFVSTIAENNNLKKNIDERVAELLSKMTIEEKVGQMTQVTIDVIAEEREDITKDVVINKDKLEEAILKYHVGSILNVQGAHHTLENWQEIITAIQDVAVKKGRLAIPVIYGVDAIHGMNYTKDATIFPQSINMAATRNAELVERSAEITAYEMKASGIPWNFNPVLGLAREPLWPRFWETFGEDVYLTSELGKHYVKGIQGDDVFAKDKGAACVKHYLGYSKPNNGLDRTPAWIPERILREIFLPPFAEAIKQGALTVMVNSSEINGIPVHADYNILTKLLKGELAFEGFVVSDWEDVKRLHTRDRIAKDHKEAVKLAVNAGLDMSMVPYDYSFAEHLVELVNEGEVPMERVDDAVSRILKVKLKLGLFENPYPNKELKENFASDQSRQVNLQAARESMTLLKNDKNILPLKKDTKVLVTGPTANKLSYLNGGWTITWQGDEEDLYPQEKFTILEAIENEIGEENVIYSQGTEIDSVINIYETVKLAENSDVIILCIGEKPYCEGMGNITNLAIDDEQIELAEALYKTGKPLVMVLVEGRPRVITEIAEQADAIVMAGLPGMEGGIAVSDVLFGNVNPSGKLPFTYPRNVSGYTTYDHKLMEEFELAEFNPLFEFGYGLSYTSFKYSGLSIDKGEYSIDDKIKVKVKVKNTGEVDGKESVELYISDLFASVTRPVKLLKRFKKVFLKAGEEKEVSFELSSNDLSFVGIDNKRIVEPGQFKMTIGKLNKEFTLK